MEVALFRECFIKYWEHNKALPEQWSSEQCSLWKIKLPNTLKFAGFVH